MMSDFITEYVVFSKATKARNTAKADWLALKALPSSFLTRYQPGGISTKSNGRWKRFAVNHLFIRCRSTESPIRNSDTSLNVSWKSNSPALVS